VAAISPFAFQRQIIFITGVFMLISIVLLLYFMKSGRRLTKQEAFLLLLFYAIFVAAELLTHLQ